MTTPAPDTRPPSASPFLAGPAWIFAALFCLAGAVALRFVSDQYHPAGPAELAALALALCGIASAVANAALPFAARHLYNMHYAALAGMASLILVVPMIADPAIPMAAWLSPLCWGGMLLAGPWAFAHLLAAACGDRRTAAFVAIATTLIFFGLNNIGRFPMLVLLAIGIAGSTMILPAHGPDRPPMKGSTSGAIVGFLLINLVILAGLGSALGLAIYALFLMQTGDLPVHEARLDAAVIIGLRFGLPVLTVPFAFSAVYAWPEGRVTRLRAGAAAVALLGGATGLHQNDLVNILASVAMLVVALGLASSLAGCVPRRERLPWAIIAAAVAATLTPQAVGVPPGNPMLSMAFWTSEAIMLGLVWLGAYLAGIRVIRRRLETVPASAPAPAGPPPSAPAPA